MRIYRAKDEQDLARKAANIMSAQIIMKPDCVLGLATGASPVGLYNQLVEWYRKGDLDFSCVRTVNLDEYKGMAPDSPQSYHMFMWEHLFSRVNIRPERVFLPDGLAPDSNTECLRYNAVITGLGGIDMQLLGIGVNGHIGFNEPGEEFAKEVHCVKLTESTKQANQKYFPDGRMPDYAYTMGIKSIMQAKRILLIAKGEKKAKALAASLQGPITPEIPASILQLHNDLTVVADDDALSLMR